MAETTMSVSIGELLPDAVKRDLRTRDAFTTDHHFRQAGFVALLEA